MMAACGRRDFDVSVPIIQLLMERDQGVNVAYKAPPSWPRNLYSRLGLSRDTPIKNAASQPELLRLLVGAGAVLDAHIVVYAVEDWCDEIAGHLGEVWVRDLANNEDLRGLYHFSQFPCTTYFCPDSFTKAECSPEPPVTSGPLGIIDLVDTDSDTESDTEHGSACSSPFIEETFEQVRPYEFGGTGRVAQQVADILGCDGDDEDGETKGDAAATNDALSLNSLAAFSSQIAAVLQEVLDMGGDVNAPDTTGTKNGMQSLDVY